MGFKENPFRSSCGNFENRYIYFMLNNTKSQIDCLCIPYLKKRVLYRQFFIKYIKLLLKDFNKIAGICQIEDSAEDSARDLKRLSQIIDMLLNRSNLK